MSEQIGQSYLQDVQAAFQNYKTLAEKALLQVSEDEFFHALDEEANSIAVIAKHLAGNLQSRWTDFLTTDGEKPDRDRDTEFTTAMTETREALLEKWESGWQKLFETLKLLEPVDLNRIVKIRGEEHTVVKAINRALAHAAYHVGQIVFLAKHFRSTEWQSLSIPRGQSQKFNRSFEAHAQHPAK